jgi:hypothetical protein
MIRKLGLVLGFLLIGFLLLQNQLLIAAVLICIFTSQASAAWFIPLGILIDGYFGAFSQVPWFSLGFLLWYVVSELVKPRLLVK